MAKYYRKEDLQFLTQLEIKSFLDSINSPRDKALFSLMYYHGLRVSEVVKIQLKDVNLERNFIFIHASKKGYSGSEHLNEFCKSLIIEYLKVRQNLETQILFLSKKKGGLSTVQVFRLFQKYGLEIKLNKEQMHPHALRHSLAVHLSRANFTAEQVKSFLRHRSIVSTMIYYKILPDQKFELQKRAFEIINQF